ncbi:hypothetical protein GCM10027026_25560 [Myroides odoratimimus subsp. xuanwuensis]
MAHRRKCKHFHRCPLHRNHTCRHKHRCKHRHHRAPSTPRPPEPAPTPSPQPEPQPQPTPEPTPPGTDPTLPSAEERHLTSRFSYGFTPALHAQVRAAGGPRAWFEAQLEPDRIADPADEMSTWWTSLDLEAGVIAQRDRDEVEGGWQAMANYARWALLRRIRSERQVLEVMAEFWEHHLHVPLYDDGVFPFRAAYGKLIRSHALGRFDEMLVAAVTHPAMGVSLDNSSSTKRAPNENLGRELLELHTVGRGNHSEDDVKASARILTGYRVDTWRTWKVWYDAPSHWVGPVKVLGFSHANAATDGRPVAEAYLTYLARHPRTAERLARKLAVRFVSDEPSAALVSHLASVYLAEGTAIRPVLRALVTSEEFRSAAGSKVRTPTDDVVATYRALGTTINKPISSSSAANQILWQTSSIGQEPFDWPRPDGQPQTNQAWSSASRLLGSFDVHYSMAGRWWPSKEISYPTHLSRLPAERIRFDALVDHLSRTLLGRPASARMQKACSEALTLPPGEIVTATHALVRWRMPILLTTLLDSPEHMLR